jgi:predicted O-methyltransferase YrrM
MTQIKQLYHDIPYLETVVTHTGYHTVNSLVFLHNLAKSINPDIILELGTGFGCSAIFMASAIKGKVITIDDYRGDMAVDMEQPMNNAAMCGVEVDFIYGKSTCIPSDIRPEIVFMDASHDCENLIAEYAAVKKVATDNHIIIIDDSFSPIGTFLNAISQQYEFGVNINFHNGMAIFATSFEKYADDINYAIREAI